MGETDFIPLFDAACRIAYGEKETQHWKNKYPLSEAFIRWVRWRSDTAPNQKASIDEFGIKHFRDCPRAAYNKKHTEKVKRQLLNILIYCANSEKDLIKGIRQPQVLPAKIPSEFLLSVKTEGIVLSSEINSHLSKKLIVTGRHLRRNLGLGANYQYSSVLVDWKVISLSVSPLASKATSNTNINTRTRKNNNYNWEWIIPVARKIYDEHGGISQDDPLMRNVTAFARLVQKELSEDASRRISGEPIPEIKYLAKKLSKEFSLG